jgi:Tfp pilus assembly protein PilV
LQADKASEEQKTEQGFTRSARRARIVGSAANSDRQQVVKESSKKRLTRSSDQIKIPLLCRQRKRSANKFFKNQQPISVGVGRRVPR